MMASQDAVEGFRKNDFSSLLDIIEPRAVILHYRADIVHLLTAVECSTHPLYSFPISM